MHNSRPSFHSSRMLTIRQPRKRARTAKAGYVSSDGLSAEKRAALTSACEAVFKHTHDVEEPDTGRVRSEIFEKLPSKKIFPDYYHIIKTPISFNEIKKRIRNGDYTDLDQFRADFKLMFDNARTYNEETALVYEDANVLEQEFEKKWQIEKENYDMIVNAANGASVDGDAASTAAMSSTGTPMAETPRIRLKVRGTSASTPAADDARSQDDSD